MNAVSILEMRQREKQLSQGEDWQSRWGMWSRAQGVDFPFLSFPQGLSWLPGSKRSVVGDTPLVKNLFPFFAALGHQ